jgi:ABC-type uncharacterized transport system substrate-binding protein
VIFIRSYRLAVIILSGLLLTRSSAEAQQPGKIPRIGFLSATPASAIAVRVNAFREGLHDLGYIERQNITIEYRYAEGKPESLPHLADELVRLKLDIIVTGGPAATGPAKKATATIPIVMAEDSDPVGYGFVASLARPGGNITGLSSVGPEMAGKRFELLKEIIPRLSRVAVLGNATMPGASQALRETENAAGAFGVKLQYIEVQSPRDIETAFRAASKGRADAVFVLTNPVLLSQRTEMANLATKNRMPTVYYQPEYVEAGGLMFYGPRTTELFRRAATYVDKILKGAKPAELPVEQPMKFEFIINLKAAKQIGLTIPPNVLARADRVIK